MIAKAKVILTYSSGNIDRFYAVQIEMEWLVSSAYYEWTLDVVTNLSRVRKIKNICVLISWRTHQSWITDVSYANFTYPTLHIPLDTKV